MIKYFLRLFNSLNIKHYQIIITLLTIFSLSIFSSIAAEDFRRNNRSTYFLEITNQQFSNHEEKNIYFYGNEKQFNCPTNNHLIYFYLGSWPNKLITASRLKELPSNLSEDFYNIDSICAN